MLTIKTEIAALLHAEHMHTVEALQDLEEFLANQTARRVPDARTAEVRGILSGLIATVAAEVGRHFAFEEDHLFPLLLEKGEGGIAALLTEEHAAILPLAQGLAGRAAKAMADGGFTAEGWTSFHAQGMELCEREISHIQKEEMGLLAAIATYVDADTDRNLAALYQKLMDAA
jgi:hemerythrin-like domain-containing protein